MMGRKTTLTHQPEGNTVDKERLTGLQGRLVARFNARALALVGEIPAQRALDVGCGDGWVTSLAANTNPACEWVGVDRKGAKLQAAWTTRNSPNLTFAVASAYGLPFPDGHFDIVTTFEVLEHLDYPCAALAECLRVSRQYVIASVPWEPMWRMGNLLKGRYVRQFGNTPGHVNHWSRRGFAQLAGWHGDVDRLQSCGPWNLTRIEKLAS